MANAKKLKCFNCAPHRERANKPGQAALKTPQAMTIEQCNGMTLDTEVTALEAVAVYRAVTGVCRRGSLQFVKDQDELKDKYTIREVVELTKGQPGAEAFAKFFEGKTR